MEKLTPPPRKEGTRYKIDLTEIISREIKREVKLPIDLTIEEFRSLIKQHMGTEIEFGFSSIVLKNNNEDATEAWTAGQRILIYSGAPDDRFISSLNIYGMSTEIVHHNQNNFKLNETNNPELHTNIAPEWISRFLFIAYEIKNAGDSTRKKIYELLNLTNEEILSDEINLSDISYSQAKRFVNKMREFYRNNQWREVLQMGLAIDHIFRFASDAKYIAGGDDNVRTVSDNNISKVLDEKFSSDIQLMMIKALSIGIDCLQNQNRTVAAEHGKKWMELLQSNLKLKKFTPETTINDIITYPSYLNPRPDKGIPVINDYHFLAGSTGSRNYTIKYPDGSIYAVDYPFDEARDIDDPEVGYRGNITDNTVGDFVHINEDTWLDFIPTVEEELALELVKEVGNGETTFKTLYQIYRQNLRKSKGNIDLAAQKMANTLLQLVNENHPDKAERLYGYMIGGYCRKDDVTNETGISLTPFNGRITNLSDKKTEAIRSLGNALYGYNSADLAEKYAKHPEMNAYIQYYRQHNNYLKDKSEYLNIIKKAVSILNNIEYVRKKVDIRRGGYQ